MRYNRKLLKNRAALGILFSLLFLLSGCDLFSPPSIDAARTNIYDPGSEGYVGVLLTAPLGTVTDARPTFTWTASILPGPVYHLQVAPDAAFSNPTIDVDGLTGLSYRPPSIFPNLTTLYWHVSVREETGREIWAPAGEISFDYSLKATSLSMGRRFTAAIREDGCLWTVGTNDRGELGDGTYTSTDTPIKIPGLTDCKRVYVASSDTDMDLFQTFVIDGQNRLWGWGINGQGQLGNDTMTGETSPIQILTGVASVSGSGHHTLALKTDGTLWAWGRNSENQLGDGTATNRLTPVQVKKSAAAGDYLTGVVSFACYQHYSLAVLEDGTLWVWGTYQGEVKAYPVQITETRDAEPLPSIELVEVNVWGTIFCLDTTGTLWAWGAGGSGILGIGSESDEEKPVAVNISRPVVQMNIRRAQGYAVDNAGVLWRWGDWGHWDQGIISNPEEYITGVVSVQTSTEECTACCIKTDESLWCWGSVEFIGIDPNEAEAGDIVEVQWP